MKRTQAIPILFALCFAALSAIPGCGRGKDDGRSAAPGSAVPTIGEAAGLTYRGLEGDSESVTLAGGRWEGPPFVEGSASRPSVYLVPDFLVPWDADRIPPDEAVVLLAENSGGSGEFIYLALIAGGESGAVNRATALLGDRVQIVSAAASGDRLKLTLLRTGPEGALCCPDEVAEEEWEYRDGALSRMPGATAPSPLTIDIMGGTEWILAEPDTVSGTPGRPAITLRYADGRFEGKSACNRYFAPVSPGEMPGDLAVGPVGSTRMACPDSVAAAAEAGYLARLGTVVKFGFSACRLMLMYEGEEGTGTLYFRRP